MNTAEFLKHDLNRRQFLGNSAANAAGVAAGMVGVGPALGAMKSPPSERVRVGIIGVRSQGLELAKTLAAFPVADVVSLCDIDERVLAAGVRKLESLQIRKPTGCSDFRRLLDDASLDAVVIATPDHWHFTIAEAALQAGKDLYLESPATHTSDEGRRLLTVAQDAKCIVQCGLQHRSGRHFRSAVEYVRGGNLGTVRLARAWCAHRRKTIGRRADAKPPAGVDYKTWLGPATARPFNPNRFHQNWRWFWDYGSGELGHWGVHFLDVARWGLDVESPDRVSSTGGVHYLKDDRETPDTQFVQYACGDKTIIWEHRQWSPQGLEGRSAACAFYGDNGTLIVDRGGWKVYGRKDAETSGPSEMLAGHVGNFLDCIKTRKRPNADLDTGLASSALCHLGNEAYRSLSDLRVDDGV